MLKPNVALIVQFLFSMSRHFLIQVNFTNQYWCPYNTIHIYLGLWNGSQWLVPLLILWVGKDIWSSIKMSCWINSHIEGSIKQPPEDSKPPVHRLHSFSLDPSGQCAHTPILWTTHPTPFHWDCKYVWLLKACPFEETWSLLCMQPVF